MPVLFVTKELRDDAAAFAEALAILQEPETRPERLLPPSVDSFTLLQRGVCPVCFLSEAECSALAARSTARLSEILGIFGLALPKSDDARDYVPYDATGKEVA